MDCGTRSTGRNSSGWIFWSFSFRQCSEVNGFKHHHFGRRRAFTDRKRLVNLSSSFPLRSRKVLIAEWQLILTLTPTLPNPNQTKINSKRRKLNKKYKNYTVLFEPMTASIPILYLGRIQDFTERGVRINVRLHYLTGIAIQQVLFSMKKYGKNICVSF